MFAFFLLWGGGMDDGQAAYRGAETTGFQSPAQDYIEHVVDLARVLDLGKPGIYPVRVAGQAFAERGIRDGDISLPTRRRSRRTAALRSRCCKGRCAWRRSNAGRAIGFCCRAGAGKPCRSVTMRSLGHRRRPRSGDRLMPVLVVYDHAHQRRRPLHRKVPSGCKCRLVHNPTNLQNVQ